MAAHYIPNFHTLVDDLTRTGCDPEKIVLVLGLTGDIWPTDIRPDVLDAEAKARKLDWKRGIIS